MQVTWSNFAETFNGSASASSDAALHTKHDLPEFRASRGWLVARVSRRSSDPMTNATPVDDQVSVPEVPHSGAT